MRRLGMVLLAILFLFMVFAGPATQKADAVVVSTVVIGAVIAAMAAAGIGLTVSGMTSAQLQDWLSGKLNDWATSIGGTVQDHIDSSQITVTGRGFLSLGTLAANGISEFIDWLKIQDSITDNSTISVISIPGVLQLTELNQPYRVLSYVSSYRNWTLYMKAIASITNMYCVGYYDGTYYHILCAVNGNQVGTGYIGYLGASFNSWDDWTSSGYFRGTYNNQYNLTYGEFFDNTFPYSSDLVSYTNTYNSFEDAMTAIRNTIDNGNAGPITLDYETTVITVPTVSGEDKWFLDVGADPGVTVQTATDGVIADTVEGTLTVSGEVAEEEPEFEVTGPIGVSGLTEVFPFCIPFDVYALLSCLSAEPQTPVFTVRFVIPGVINQEFTIDLSPFSTIAQIVRTMELIAFAIGLALVTRERFLRS